VNRCLPQKHLDKAPLICRANQSAVEIAILFSAMQPVAWTREVGFGSPIKDMSTLENPRLEFLSRHAVLVSARADRFQVGLHVPDRAPDRQQFPDASEVGATNKRGALIGGAASHKVDTARSSSPPAAGASVLSALSCVN
jgi:hypothetical protein